MKVFRHWARASAPTDNQHGLKITCYGGSNASVDDALREAQERAKSAAKRFNQTSRLASYDYANGSLREEIVNELQDNGKTVAVITRNMSGCLVLNSPNVFFADMDYPAVKPRSSFFAGLASFFGGEKPSPTDQGVVDTVQRIANADSRLGIRLYRTKNGFRSLITTRTFDAISDETNRLLQDFGADPLYVKLCRAQECFRARLTPKPWRCGVSQPTERFPFENNESESRHRNWIKKYEEAARPFTTCVLIGQFGSNAIHPDVDSVLRVHDQLACHGNGPLA